MTALFGVSYFSNGAYDTATIEAGNGFNIGLKMSHQISNAEVSCYTYYDQRNQNTSILKLNEKQIGFNCGYVLEYK
jgi:hypothetical protein